MERFPLINAENIIATMADALIIVDLDKKIVTVNEATTDLFGYTREDLIGKQVTIIFPGSEALFLAKKFKELMEDGVIQNYTAVCLAKSGTQIPIRFSMSVLKDNNMQSVGIICVGQDMREVKRNMQQLRKLATIADRAAAAERGKTRELEALNKQLEKANKAKSEFLVNMSHELRTPLNSVIGFSEVLLNKAFGEINQKQEEYVNDILDSGKHLLSLINDILDLSKVEAGKEELRIAPFSLKELMDESLGIFKEKAMKYNLELSIGSNNQTDIVVADRRKIKQVLFNLLSNATKFTPPGGKISIEVEEEPEQLLISVLDTGKGIPEKDYKRVFERFQQLDGGYTKKYPGTGIGLALVKEFTHMHKGDVWVKSEVDKWTRFTFSLPKDLDYKMFELHMVEAFDMAMVEGLFLAFIMIRIRYSYESGKQGISSDIRQVLEDVDPLLKNALYRPEDKLFKLRTGFCAVVLGKTDRASVEIVMNRFKETFDKYNLPGRFEDMIVDIKMVTYPEDIAKQKGVMKELEKFGL
ncbi:MAG: PAS domain-containing sensor histidine kinase [bacterium]